MKPLKMKEKYFQIQLKANMFITLLLETMLVLTCGVLTLNYLGQGFNGIVVLSGKIRVKFHVYGLQ